MLDKKRVYVCQIQSSSWKNLLPLSAGMLISFAKKDSKLNSAFNFEIEIARQKPRDIVKKWHVPDVLAFSTYSWNFLQSLLMAKIAKQHWPNSLVVFGGPMISFHTGYLAAFFQKYPFVDLVVHGMGEWPFSEILHKRLTDGDYSFIAGVSFRQHNGQTHTTPPVYIRNLENLPSPFLDHTFDDIMARHGDIITGALWETNRGCPYQCAYCVQGNSDFSKILTLNIDRLRDELEWIGQKKISYMFCTDANYGILPRDLDIAHMLIATHRRYGYPNHFIVNWAKHSNLRIINIAEILRQGKVNTRLTLSLQSVNQKTLRAIKRQNIKQETFNILKHEAANRDIPTYSELILGLPEDNYDSLLSGLELCLDYHLNHYLIIYLCRLLDGTAMAEPAYRKRYGLVTKTCKVGIARHSWVSAGINETENIIVSTSTLPLSDWKRIFDLIYLTLALYNFRLTFFIFNYFRAEYSVRVTDMVEFMIHQIDKAPGKYTVIRQGLNIIRAGRRAVLKGQSSLVSLKLTGAMLLEVHEAALILMLNNLDRCYDELRLLIAEYSDSQGLRVDADIIEEGLQYNHFLIPRWSKPPMSSRTFGFNFSRYFYSLCVKGKKINICKEKSCVKLIKPNQHIEDPESFIKSRLTISTFDIFKVENR